MTWESLALPIAAPEHWDAETSRVIAAALTRTGRYRVVERFERRARYCDGPCAEGRWGLYVDVETTGLDATTDRIIQLAVVPFEFDATGRIFRVEDCLTFLEDPGCAIPAAITRLTGISDDMVAGQRIDDARVLDHLARSRLVVAHNAAFDRSFLERRLPSFATAYWACSIADVPWEREGFRSAKLEWLAYEHGQMFYDAHRADSDCYMGIHLLALPLPSGTTGMSELLVSARRRTTRVWAVGAEMRSRHVLKQRGYRWSDGATCGFPKAWWKEVAEGATRDEIVWLTTNCYAAGCEEAIRLERVDGRTRYSARVGRLLPVRLISSA